MNVPCYSCREREWPCLGNTALEHILDKHYHQTNAIGVSKFYPNTDPLLLLETFKDKLCAGILEGKVDLRDPSAPRLIYYCPIEFEVGTYPIGRWSIPTEESSCVRVVCTTSRCCCNLLVPRWVITIFPDRDPN